MPFPRLMIQFTIPQRDWLRAEARRLGISVAELVRRIVDGRRLDPGAPRAPRGGENG